MVPFRGVVSTGGAMESAIGVVNRVNSKRFRLFDDGTQHTRWEVISRHFSLIRLFKRLFFKVRNGSTAVGLESQMYRYGSKLKPSLLLRNNGKKKT
jgi:hypothetical protein